MDNCFQITHHRTFDDTRGGAKGYIEVSLRTSVKIGDQQLLREYVFTQAILLVKSQETEQSWQNEYEVQVQGNNIRNYHHYLLARAKAFHDTKLDWVREGPARLKRLTVDKGLLRETETVQRQIKALLQCDVSIVDGTTKAPADLAKITTGPKPWTGKWDYVNGLSIADHGSPHAVPRNEWRNDQRAR